MLKPLTVWIKKKQKNSEGHGNMRPPYLPPEKSVCKSRSNSYKQTCNNELFPHWEGSMSRLYIVALLI